MGERCCGWWNVLLTLGSEWKQDLNSEHGERRWTGSRRIALHIEHAGWNGATLDFYSFVGRLVFGFEKML